MLLRLYRNLTNLGGPVISRWLRRRMAGGKEDPVRYRERFGIAGRSRPSGPLVWIHAASVGEALSILPLLARLTEIHPGLSLVLTTGTVSSAQMLAERLPPGILHQYVPVDRLSYVRRFLDHWRPGLVLLTESELWPNTLCEIARRTIPLVLINGRVSDRSFRRWQRVPGTIGTLLRGFSLCLGQSEVDRERLARLGAPVAEYLGNLKMATPPLSVREADLTEWRSLIHSRPVWVAASTHDGEEVLIGRVHQRLQASHPGLLTLLVPRHPPRGPGIAAELAALGLTVARRGNGDPLTEATDIYLADTMGELGLFYRLAGIAFIGKSLVPFGGQNPLEAARLGCALLFGPHMSNFADISARMLAKGAAREVADDTALADALSELLHHPERRAALADSALAFVSAEEDAEILDRILSRLAPFIDRIPGNP
ncbi:MAG: 3-deoxy-D-manno-octulosonic acid transferase [Alphaproteobacteria bacterium]